MIDGLGAKAKAIEQAANDGEDAGARAEVLLRKAEQALARFAEIKSFWKA